MTFKEGDMCTVLAITSGNPLTAVVIRVSKWRKFFGRDYIYADVETRALRGIVWRSHWFSESEITKVG